jgi:DNA invertase Pin-like site-specific DNA recombinase
MRLLAVTRLSDKSDQTNSPERQLKSCHADAAKHGHVIIGEAQDVESVSGDVAPWDRPKLGMWLRERGDEFDGIIVDRPNRLSRNTLHFLQLQEEFYKSGKVLISVKPRFDFSTPEGRKFARDQISVAQFEREETAEQVKRSVKELRDMGRYWGGPIPYGVRKVELAAKGFGRWGYEIDDRVDAHIAMMAGWFLAGESLRGITRELNKREIPSPQGVKWCPESVRIVLRSPAITGLAVDKGEIYRDDDGNEVRICDPIIPFDQWLTIRELMAANAHSGPRSEPSNLFGIVTCARDGAPYYSMSQTTRGKLYRYLRCGRNVRPIGAACASSVVQAELVETALSETIMTELGDVKRQETIRHRGRDYAAEIAQADHSIEALQRQMLAGNLSAERFATMVTRFEELKAGYEAKREPESTEVKILEETFGDHWQALDWKGRQKFCVRHGITVKVGVPDLAAKLGIKGTEPTDSRIRFSKLLGPTETGRLVQIGNQLALIWLGDLEPLRKSAAVA